MPLGILFSLLILIASGSQVASQVCSLYTICNDIKSIDSQVYSIRLEQDRQANLLEDLNNKIEPFLNRVDHWPSNCYEALRGSQNGSIRTILVPEYSDNPFEVACDQFRMGGGWTIILRRTDGSENFFREWNDYKHGFGSLSNEYFLGLDILHAMTNYQQQELLVIMETPEGQQAYEMYDNFRIGSESSDYTLETLGTPSGDAGDSLAIHLGMKFSTKDRKNDIDPIRNCAQLFTGAWWYRACMHSNLAGKYGDNTVGKGVNWKLFSGYESSLRRATMMIRPKTN
ncbi:microfibril-associated glycoprotein 4-like [Drosophila subpulchrella]|uniref:microfibril-associated glycoprotein 4-like n=1 Tax=Drosophila subpulchrella TaxID=1486046 RepID=UPI0018A14B3D|nr:microfibril-associated glycoprotein 4-like [Drosophila subpulchrella]